MSTPVLDKIFLGIGALLFAGGCTWAFFQQGQLAELRQPINPPTSGASYEPAALPETTISEAEPWPRAKAMARGDKWVYDVFTPPVIYYNTGTRQFTVTPPVSAPEVQQTEVVKADSFGLSLLEAKQPLFPLQLVGYIGSGAGAQGNFQNEKTGEVIIGAAGKEIPGLNLKVVQFAVEAKHDVVDGQSIFYTVAKALVLDTQTGAETTLTNTERAIESDPIAVVKVDGETDPRELTAGETLTVGDVSYKIDSIEISPPSVTITKTGENLPEAKTETLTPLPPAAVPSSSTTGAEGEKAAPSTIDNFPDF